MKPTEGTFRNQSGTDLGQHFATLKLHRLSEELLCLTYYGGHVAMICMVFIRLELPSRYLTLIDQMSNCKLNSPGIECRL
jgi:hypothetical protein